MTNKRSFGDFEPIDPYDWMHKMSQTLERAIHMQQHFERDLMAMKNKVIRLNEDIVNLRVALDLDKIQRDLDNDKI